MYDPFATQPPPGMVNTTAVPQQPQVMPNPMPVAPNNAMAALYGKHMRNMGGPNTQFPLNPGAQTGWLPQFLQARQDWRGQMPDRPTFDGARPDDWRTQMDAYRDDRRDWRQLMPRGRDYRMGTVPPTAV